jgi:hypothetical protein
MNNELEKILKEVVSILIKILLQYFPEWVRTTMKNLSQEGQQALGIRFDPGTPEYEALVLTTQLQCLVLWMFKQMQGKICSVCVDISVIILAL